MRYPNKIDIELVRGICTADCPMCSIDEARYNKKIMDDAMFESIINRFADSLKKIDQVNLVGIGEVLVDKNICHKINFLKSKKVKCVSFPTNGNPLSVTKSQMLLESGLDEIIFGVDSLNPKIYEKVRKGLKFEKTMENVHNYIKIRDNGFDSKIMIRMILSEENRNEWEEYKKYWEKYLNFSKGDMILYFNEHNWSSNKYPNMKDYMKQCDKEISCRYVYDRIGIDTYGNVKFCCIDINASFFELGNVLRTKPVEIFNNKIFTDSRKLMGEGKIDHIKPCSLCNVPLMREKRGYYNGGLGWQSQDPLDID